jgi:hypothetical protein
MISPPPRLDPFLYSWARPTICVLALGHAATACSLAEIRVLAGPTQGENSGGRAATFLLAVRWFAGGSVPVANLSSSGFELDTPAPVGGSAAAYAEREANGLRRPGPGGKPSEGASREAQRLPRAGQSGPSKRQGGETAILLVSSRSCCISVRWFALGMPLRHCGRLAFL